MSIFPEVITTEYIVSQVLGFISLVILCIGYFLQKGKLLFTQIIGNGINSVSYLLLSSFVGGVGSTICLLRTIIFYIYNKENKKVPLAVFCLILISYVACLFATWNGYITLFPILCYMLFTISFMMNNEMLIRIFSVIALLFSITYNILIYNVLGYIRNSIELLMIIISLVEILVKRKKLKHE